jgi:TonB family protein
MDLMLARRTVRDTEAQLAPLIKLSSRGVAQVTLQPGDRVVLDYISTSVRTISPNMATEVAYVTGRPACDVVGMGLEISIESAPKAPTIVESELWLIHTRPDKTEETQHQTLRVRAGDSAMYWFDDVAVLLPATPFAGGELKPIRVAEVPIQVSGRLSPVDLGDGKIHMKLTIARSGQSAHTRIASPNVAAVTLGPPTGSTTYDLTAEPGEVLSFQLPPIRTPAGTADGAFSVRLRARTLGLSLVAPEGAQAPAQAGTMSDAHQALLTEALLFPGVAEVLKVTVVASGVPSPPAPTQHLSPSYRPPGTPAPALDMSTVVEPKLLSKVDPIYPPSAIADGVQGTSIGEAIIDHEGRVIEARIIDGGVARLDQATLDAIKQWRYSPMKQGGVAKAILINFRIIYALR